MLIELNQNELMLVNGGNVSDKIFGVIKIGEGAIVVVFGATDPIIKVAGLYAIADGITGIFI